MKEALSCISYSGSYYKITTTKPIAIPFSPPSISPFRHRRLHQNTPLSSSIITLRFFLLFFLLHSTEVAGPFAMLLARSLNLNFLFSLACCYPWSMDRNLYCWSLSSLSINFTWFLLNSTKETACLVSLL